MMKRSLEATRGNGVYSRRMDDAALGANLEFLAGTGDVPILVQSFVGDPRAHRDYRVLVVGGEVIDCAERWIERDEMGNGNGRKEGAVDEVRTNYSVHGNARGCELDDESKEVALAATAALGLDIGGVDVIPTARGALVIEVNTAPGFDLHDDLRQDGTKVADDIIACVLGEPVGRPAGAGRVNLPLVALQGIS